MNASVAFAWELSSVTGWGLYGQALLMGLLQRGDHSPVLLKKPARLDPDPLEKRTLEPLLRQQEALFAQVTRGGTLSRADLPLPVVKTLAPGFKAASAGEVFFGRPDVGVIFFEDTKISLEDVERSKRYARIVSGSTWNQQLLLAAGVHQSHRILQGVDRLRFRPGPRRRLPGEPFVVFSGGKLEHRKGQDLVLAGFKRFRARHPEALLMVAWQNVWPNKIRDLARSPHVLGLPDLRADGTLQIEAWAARNGLPPGSVIDLGLLPNRALPELMAAAHCAVFASRYESGTNLPAMEALSMGIPCILSKNTGHLDLPGPALWLEHQAPVRVVPEGWGSEGYGESDPEEIAAALERLYSDSDLRTEMGAAASAAMQALSWENQVDQWATLLRHL